MDDRFSRTVRICNLRGLHARAAAKFVQVVETFGASVTVVRGTMSVTGNSIMGLMALSASNNTEIVIQASGAGAAEALAALTALVEDRFGEEM